MKLQGLFTVRMGQDPRLIINQEHNKKMLEMKLAEEFGAQAVKKSSWRQQTNPNSLFVETEASVIIMSVEEMRNLEQHIKFLEEQLELKKYLGGQL